VLLTQEQIAEVIAEINEQVSHIQLSSPALAQLGLVQPAYIRLPKWGERCPLTGLTRSALDLLTRAQEGNNFRPPVRSKLFKQTGQKSGIKLIDYRSLRIHLDSLPDGSKVVTPRRKDLTHQEHGSEPQ